jgi:hypothetical protein
MLYTLNTFSYVYEYIVLKINKLDKGKPQKLNC